MTAHVMDNHRLIIVGGVKLNCSHPPVIMVDLGNLTWKGIDIMVRTPND